MSVSILIVESHEDGATSQAELYRLWGYDVRVASCASEALRSEATPDIVVLELKLPDLDGCELTRRMKSNGNGKCPRFIALTTSVFDDDRRRAAEAGIEVYLIKPINPFDMYDALNKLAAPR